jgi:hypothetical protein
VRDLVHRLKAAQSIASTAVTSGNTATNGNGVATAGFDSVTGLLRLSARTDGTYTPKFQISADGTNWYDLDAAGYAGGAVPGAANAVGDTLFGMIEPRSAAAITAGVDPTVAQANVRIVVTQASGTTGATFQADVLLSHPRHADVQTTQI